MSIAAAIEYLCSHDEERLALGRRGRAIAEGRFNWRVEESKLLELYGTLGAS